MASSFKFKRDSFGKIVLNGRSVATKEQATKGRKVLLTIQGDGNTIDVKDKDGKYVQSASDAGVGLQKRIYNTYCNSEVAMTNPANVAAFKQAKAEEKAGNADKAHELYQSVSNAFQLSFGVLYGGKGDKLISQLGDNVEISAKLMLITTEKGSIITIDPKTITVMEPDVLEATTLPSSYLDDEDEDATVATPESALEGAEA
jgi:hypothetical protein